MGLPLKTTWKPQLIQIALKQTFIGSGPQPLGHSLLPGCGPFGTGLIDRLTGVCACYVQLDLRKWQVGAHAHAYAASLVQAAGWFPSPSPCRAANHKGWGPLMTM